MQPSKEIQTSRATQISRQNNRQSPHRLSPKSTNISRFAPVVFIDGKYSPFLPALQPAKHAARTTFLEPETRSATLRHVFASASQKSPSLRTGAPLLVRALMNNRALHEYTRSQVRRLSKRSLDIQVKPTYPDAKDHLNAK